MTQPPVELTEDETITALDAIVKESDEMESDIDPAILSVESCHAHLLSKFSIEIRPAVGRLKAAATRRLHREGFAEKRVWVRGCHMKSKSTPREVENAFEYVARHRHDGAIVYAWRIPDYENEC